MYIPLSDDKHRFVQDSSKKAHWKSETKFIPRENLRNIFSDKFFFKDKKKFLTKILLEKFSWEKKIIAKEFCRKKNLEFCLGLHTAVVFRMQSFNFYVKDKTYNRSSVF